MPPVSRPSTPVVSRLHPEDIVISGISGQMPKCDNLKEFRDRIFNKEDLLVSTEDCWGVAHPDLPPTVGKLSKWCKFDTEFFGFDPEEATTRLDPQIARLAEDSYEAMIDAGVHPSSLKGKKTAVIVGTSISEPSKLLCYNHHEEYDGPRRYHSWFAMMPNFLSAFFGFTGPSYIADTACSSFLYAFTKAYEAMQSGECDSALVCCSSMLFGHVTTIQFNRLGVLSTTPHCRPMDEKGDGYVRSEAVGAVLLQRARDAKRAYAVVVHAETSADGFKEENITFPSRTAQAKLLRSVYSKPGVDARALAFMEVHATGTTVGDPVELGAIEDVFFEEGRRTSPLLIGSIKSNLGHTEPSSGFCSLAKLLIAIQEGCIPPNIHYRVPRKGIPSLNNGRMKVLTNAAPLGPGLVAINNFGFGGANAHVILRPGPSRRGQRRPSDTAPRLVLASGRTEEAALALVHLAAAGGADVDVELVRLLHELSATPTPGHAYRAFALVPAPPAPSALPAARRCGDARPAVWLALAGAGAWAGSWAGVSTALQRLPAFAAALHRRDAPLAGALSDAAALQEALLEVLRAAGVREERRIVLNGKGAYVDLKDAVVLLVAPPGDATRAMRKALECKGDTERTMAVFGDAGDQDPLLGFLCALGKLYCLGVGVQAAALYEDVPLPVSAQTPMLSPHVRWDHSRVALRCEAALAVVARGVALVGVALTSPEHSFMKGHVIDGRNLLPATGYLNFVWGTFGESIIRDYPPVVFEEVRFLRATNFPKDYGQIDLLVTIHRDSGAFEVCEGTTAVVTGYVRLMTDEDRSQMLPPAEPWDPSADAASPHMTPRDVYKALRLRGYNYSGLFRGIAAASCDGRRGLLRWDDNWVTFLDCMMQLQLLSDASGALAVPTAIRRLCIDVANHTPLLQVATAMVDVTTGAVRAGGVELRGLRANVIARRKPAGDPVLERYDFAPYRLDEEGEEGEEEEETWAEAVRVCAQIALENRGPLVRGAAPLTALEVLTEKAKWPLAPLLLSALGDMPLVQMLLKAFFDEGVENAMKEAIEAEGADTVTNMRAFLEETEAAFVIGHCLLADGWLGRARSVLSHAGCILTLEEGVNMDGEEEQIRAAGLRLVLRWRRGRHALLLLRKGGWEVDARRATVVHIRQEADEEAGEAFAWLPTLQAALREARRPEQRVLLVAEGQPLAGAQGLFNCLRQEPGPGRDKLRLYVLEEGAEPFSLESDAYRKQLELDLAVNELRDGRWGCMRHFLFSSAVATGQEAESGSRIRGSEHAYCDAATMGDLSSFTWFEGDLSVHKPALNQGHELIHIYYSSLNFKDVMLASGKLNAATIPTAPGQRCLIGFEVSGRTSDGRRVMGVSVEGGSIATVTSVKKYYMWDIPENWSLEEAATVPAAYFTAVYALMKRGRMRRGDSVLVHAGSGGVGQAAIHLALAQGCRVFATAGTDAKRRFLLRTFPQLAAEDVGNSRDCSFEALVLRRTAGRGVDLVLNSLAGDKLLASLRCLTPGGRFLEIGKFDMQTNTLLDSGLLSDGRSFHGILLDKFWLDSPEHAQEEFAGVFRDLVKQGALRPLQAHVYERDNVEEAFRFMAAGKHIGKVLVRIRPEEKEKVKVPSPLAIKAKRRFHCHRERSYVICGGLGGFGLELADWLVSRGCKHLVLTSRRGVSNGYQARKMLLWQRKGVRVHIFTGDAATHAGADALLRAANALAPLAAIFNLAVVLRDGLFDNQTVDAFVESYRCKALATRRLDQASRRLCPGLSHFVVFSSVSCGRGNAGQTNYGLANSVMEGVVRGRREAGLPATAVQWGAVGDVGLVADMRDDDRQLEIGGTLQQRLSSCLEVLDGFLTGSDAVVSSMVVAEKRARGHGGDLVSLVADIFGIRDVRTVSPESTLADLGLDSMMAVEIQQALERDFEISMTVQELRAVSFARLSEMQEERNQTQTPGAEDEKRIGKDWQRALFPWEQLLPLARGSLLEGGVALRAMGSSPAGGASIILLPGAEDAAELLEPLAARLRGPAHCLQMGGLADRCSVGEMVDKLTPVVMEHLKSRQTFQILGYSFGGLLALELATRLEELGLRGRLVLLDSSPDFMQGMLLAQLKGEFDNVDAISDSAFEDNAATSLLSTLENMSIEEARSVLEAHGGSWEQRLARALQTAETLGISRRALSTGVEKTISRGCAVRDYRWPAGRCALHSPVALVRPARSPYPVHDYGLSKICRHHPSVHCIEGVDHNTIVANTATADVINDVLKRRTNQ